jgi:hypothetical protein
MGTLTLDFQENGVHLVNKDHFSENFGKQFSINREVVVQKFTLKVNRSVSLNFGELCLMLKAGGKGELAV